MHNIVPNANEELPDFLSILHNEDKPPFFNDRFPFTDPRPNRPRAVPDPDGLQVNVEETRRHSACVTPATNISPTSL